MHIFVDHCIHTDVAEALGNAEFKIERAVDKGLERAPDEEIFRHVLKSGQVLLTFDKDFGNIIRFNIRRSKGVVIVYIEGMTKKEIIQQVLGFFRKIKEKELRSSLFIIEPKRIRIWRH